MPETSSTTTNGLERGFATAMEAANYLRLSKSMIHKLIHEQQVPASRYGRSVRVPWSWLKKQAGEPHVQ